MTAPLLAHHAFLYVHQGLPAETAEQLASVIRQENRPRVVGQSGFSLADIEFGDLLDGAKAMADLLVPEARLNLERSSCRRQLPDRYGTLPLHQDVAAMTLKGESEPSRGIVIWLPLCEIDAATPTLQVCPVLPEGPLPHHTDDATVYSVMTEPGPWPLLTLSHMELGDYLVMTPLTIHRTYVLREHFKTRLSLDLRFFAP